MTVSLTIVQTVHVGRGHRTVKHRTVVIGSASVSLRNRVRRNVKITLNATGRRLLRHSHKVRTSVQVMAWRRSAAHARLTLTVRKARRH